MSADQTREKAIADFEAVATPEEKLKAGAQDDALLPVLAAAGDLQVRNATEAQQATEFLARIAREKRSTEEARKALTKPLNDHVKFINERFKGNAALLEEADAVVRQRVIAFNDEQERIRAEEQRRIDEENERRRREAEEERRRVEAEARERREAAAREAARAEEEARRAERERAEELARAASELDARIGAMTEEELQRTAGAADERGPAARAELERRRQTREAQERAAAAREAEEQARAAEEAARNAPAPDVVETQLAPTEPTRSGSGATATARKTWEATVIDEMRVPRKYLQVDMKAIRAAVRAGEREIPGVKIEQKSGLAVRAQ